MKKVIFSFTLICYSLSGKTSIVDAYQHIPTSENHTNLLNTPSIINSVVPPTVSDLLDVPAATSNTDPISTVEAVINNPTDTLAAVTMPDVVATVIDLLDSSAVTKSMKEKASTDRLPLVSTLPNLENIGIPDLLSIPNAVENLPALAIAGALPDEVLAIENVISNELKSNVKHKEIICYKKVVGDITYFIFVPNTQKNYLSDAYQTIIELVSAISAKLQEYFAKNNAESSTAVEDSAPSITE
ncbi:MAG TPA: hypothetical protein VL201_00730 [Patescibacteria group bacterium]|jgi:hypothetical protein|nr:hypothetical protein [Patescibacteria group bacterium]